MKHIRWIVLALAACILCFLSGAKVFSQGVAVPHRPGRAAPAVKLDVPVPKVNFEDVAAKAGLTARHVTGPDFDKKYIIETTGSGVAVFDYDNDGWPDIFFVNGTTLEGFPKGQEPTNHLYRNNRDGTFTDVTEKANLVRSGWGQGACVGDYDNDGNDDLLVTYFGQQVCTKTPGRASSSMSRKRRVSCIRRRAGRPVVRSWTTTRTASWTCLCPTT